ncbi:MAG TPA: hypothetical protein PLG90_06490 [Ignavibacteria bacterium]|nr:hypothetical protein [Ignavibacteria bacterium]
MEITIWIIVALISIGTLVITMLTSVTKWSNGFVKKYVKDEEKGFKVDDENSQKRKSAE